MAKQIEIMIADTLAALAIESLTDGMLAHCEVNELIADCLSADHFASESHYAGPLLSA
jgi:hypothetical protein